MSTTTKPIQTLELPGFDIYTRASYMTRFGEPAPPADSKRKAKAWVGSGTFYFLQGMALVQMTVPVADHDVNIEGAGPFPPNMLAPTHASSRGQGGNPYNPLYLSLEADVRSLMDELKGKDLVEEGQNRFNPIFYPPEELRREWEFTIPNGVKVNAGALLFIRNMQGIGAPGHWDLSHPNPSWVAEHPTPDLTQGPWGPPCRPLDPNESIGPTGIFGAATLITTTPDAPNSTPAAAADGYTQADRDRDNTILAIVEQLAQKA